MLVDGTYYWSVQSIDGAMAGSEFSAEDYFIIGSATLLSDPSESALNFHLSQNYPNPFNPTTKISWQLAVGSPVTLTVYNLSGQTVAILVDEIMPAGNHAVNFDARHLAGGVYFYQINANNFTQTRKMLLVK